VVDLQRYRSRLIVAFAFAIALHEVILPLLHSPARPNDDERHVAVTRITIETPAPTPRPTPTPQPTPPPTPPPRLTVPPRATLAPVPQLAARAQGTPQRRHGGGARRALVLALSPAPYAAPSAAGSGIGTTVGVGSGKGATGGGAGGNGAAVAGNGNGAANVESPCGFVDFSVDPAGDERNGTTVSERVFASVTFPDGHHSSPLAFPYRWVYANAEETDPWSATNLVKKTLLVTLQTPPPNADVSAYPPMIQYILHHSHPDGTTDLPPCPTGAR
jgi:hypothetical protein